MVALTPSHTIAQKDCEQYGHPEAIAEEENIECQCQACHVRWESGDPKLPTYERRMAYVRRKAQEWDTPELYNRYLNKGPYTLEKKDYL